MSRAVNASSREAGKPAIGVGDRRLQDLWERQAAEAAVQLDPAVDAARHRHRPHVAMEGKTVETLGAVAPRHRRPIRRARRRTGPPRAGQAGARGRTGRRPCRTGAGWSPPGPRPPLRRRRPRCPRPGERRHPPTMPSGPPPPPSRAAPTWWCRRRRWPGWGWWAWTPVYVHAGRMAQGSTRAPAAPPGGLDGVEAAGGAAGGGGPATPVTSALASASVPTWLSNGPAPSAATAKLHGRQSRQRGQWAVGHRHERWRRSPTARLTCRRPSARSAAGRWRRPRSRSRYRRAAGRRPRRSRRPGVTSSRTSARAAASMAPTPASASPATTRTGRRRSASRAMARSNAGAVMAESVRWTLSSSARNVRGSTSDPFPAATHRPPAWPGRGAGRMVRIRSTAGRSCWPIARCTAAWSPEIRGSPAAVDSRTTEAPDVPARRPPGRPCRRRHTRGRAARPRRRGARRGRAAPGAPRCDR